MKYIRILSTGFIFFLGIWVSAQNASSVSEMKSQSDKLENAIKSNDEKKQAEAYVSIADTYYNQNNFSKSEEYLLKAKAIYEKSSDKELLANVSRKLAQTQENQKKINAAALNYEKAAQYSKSKKKQEANKNDYSRVMTNSSAVKEKAIQDNISLNEGENSAELAKDYSNLAEINVQQNNIPKAAENFNNAYEISKNSQHEQALAINKKMADLYIKNEDFDKAIAVKKKVLNENFVKENSQEKVNQIQELADIYIQTNNIQQAEKLLEDAYKIAIEKGHTLEAHKSVLKLDSLYNSEGNTAKSITLYKNFLTQIPSLLEKDHSLVDSKLMKETEDKIAQLEKEKNLNQLLMKRKNLFNYLLTAGLVFAVAFIIFALYTQRKLKIQNKKIELQSLRREMNPHFIFNSLNSVNQFIAENNELEANSYLTKFSKLMRGVMENSKDDFINFQEELDLLKNYLALEKSRFADKFDYEINVDENLLNSGLQLPGMLIQPYLENSIWHGLRYLKTKGFLKLSFRKEAQKLIITIEDNGIGIAQSKAQKTEHQKQRNGRGMKNTDERIRLLNDLYGKNIQKKVTDKTDAAGVTVSLSMQI